MTPVDAVIDVAKSNQSQQRGAHGVFRYFGKLAPDVTAVLLREALSVGELQGGRILDPMCGSGTTLIEAAGLGLSAIGADVNPVAVLYSRVKTRSLDVGEANALLRHLLCDPWSADSEGVAEVFGKTSRADRWFSEFARFEIARLRLLLGQIPASRERDALLATLLSRLRAYSNASARTGRIFYDPDSAVQDIRGDFERSALSVLAAVPGEDLDCVVAESDARRLEVADESVDVMFCHPPYFGLYRFSADVLRFELEVGGWNRRRVAGQEVAEGWKSGDVGLLDRHIEDMQKVIAEARRVLRPGGVMVLVTSNSTLGDVQLPVIDRLVAAASQVSMGLQRHVERKARYGSASYHRSARTDKVIQRDHALFFTAI